MNKRERIFGLLKTAGPWDYVPAGFFIHFPEQYHYGQAAVDKHLEYFRYTGMDFVKIQFENRFPDRPEIRRPADWANMPQYGPEFYENQLGIVKGLVDAVGTEAPIIMTLYSTFMCAGQTVDKDLLVQHLQEDPEQVKKGFEAISQSLLYFVRECIKLGVDGFYASTQGGESFRLGNSDLFNNYVKPFDLLLMNEMNAHCPFNILHVCDYHGGYDDLSPFPDYPGQIVNCSLKVGDGMMTGQQVAALFGRPFMGGLDRHGIIAQGSPAEVAAATREILAAAPDQFMLGADCTLPGEVDWDNIKTAIDTAHGHAQ
ncbi:MAG: hypothetical protein KDE59_02310 [Anaerolineales bacterium]|nr:hypothetical protein [Anaerolineales bacterium]